jgi:sugar/nucleoside kinase (ribokinase family)
MQGWRRASRGAPRHHHHHHTLLSHNGRSHRVLIPTAPLPHARLPAGAGDAFFGGVIASVHAWGFPTSADTLLRIGRVAAASGAACVEVVGALPVPGVR